MCNIWALVSVWKTSTTDIIGSRENIKTQATSNTSNETPRFDAVNFLVAVWVGFNYCNYILKHFFVKLHWLSLKLTIPQPGCSHLLDWERNVNFSVKGKLLNIKCNYFLYYIKLLDLKDFNYLLYSNKEYLLWFSLKK